MTDGKAKIKAGREADSLGGMTDRKARAKARAKEEAEFSERIDRKKSRYYPRSRFPAWSPSGRRPALIGDRRVLAEEEDSICACGERNRGKPGKRVSCLDGFSLVLGSHDGQPALRSEETNGGGEGLGHIVHRAESDAVEAGSEGFRAGSMDFCRKIKCSDGFAEKGGLLVLRFGEGDGNFIA
jgi:hypothetical protein